MLTGALRFRADELRARLDAPADARMITRVSIALAVKLAERAWLDVERAERSIHYMLDKPSRFTVADLLNARHARAAALDEFALWCDAVKDGSDQLFGVDFVASVCLCGYVNGAAKERSE